MNFFKQNSICLTSEWSMKTYMSHFQCLFEVKFSKTSFSNFLDQIVLFELEKMKERVASLDSFDYKPFVISDLEEIKERFLRGEKRQLLLMNGLALRLNGEQRRLVLGNAFGQQYSTNNELHFLNGKNVLENKKIFQKMAEEFAIKEFSRKEIESFKKSYSFHVFYNSLLKIYRRNHWVAALILEDIRYRSNELNFYVNDLFRESYFSLRENVQVRKLFSEKESCKVFLSDTDKNDLVQLIGNEFEKALLTLGGKIKPEYRPFIFESLLATKDEF